LNTVLHSGWARVTGQNLKLLIRKGTGVPSRQRRSVDFIQLDNQTSKPVQVPFSAGCAGGSGLRYYS